MFKKINKLCAFCALSILSTLFINTQIASAEEAVAEAPSLYERMGAWDGINNIVTDTIALHMENPLISHYFENVDLDNLAEHVTAFFAAGTGGPAKYTGRDMTSTHATMHMSTADYDSAVADVLHAAKDNGLGEQERSEVAAILESLRQSVIGPGGD